MALVLDTGVLLGALDERDPEHSRCRGCIDDATEPLVIPSPVLVELDYWIRKVGSAGAWLAFCEEVESGAYEVFQLDRTMLLQAARLQERYADLPIGYVDAAVFTVCERREEKKVATLDRRHFSVLKTADGDTLEILPE